MFKRIFWFFLGAISGALGTVWLLLQLRSSASRFTPEGVATQVEESWRSLSAELAEVVHDGREIMRETEANLRRELSNHPL
ncbi:MAG: hypothetical protein WC184_00705 [Acidimicrobiia bacterium]